MTKQTLIALVTISWCAVAAVPAAAAEPPSAPELLAASIAFHDPDGVWDDGAFELELAETRPSGSDRETTLWIDNGAGTFRIRRASEGHVTEGHSGQGVGQAECTWTLDGSADIADAVREEKQLTCDRLTLLRNYYVYLWGLPMKLRDPGTRLGDVTETEVDGETVYRLRVTYDEGVGTDIWDFDFDPETSALVGYRFVHAGPDGGGEWITLEGMTEGAGLRLPKTRTWYRLEGERLGADALTAIRGGS